MPEVNDDSTTLEKIIKFCGWCGEQPTSHDTSKCAFKDREVPLNSVVEAVRRLSHVEGTNVSITNFYTARLILEGSDDVDILVNVSNRNHDEVSIAKK